MKGLECRMDVVKPCSILSLSQNNQKRHQLCTQAWYHGQFYSSKTSGLGLVVEHFHNIKQFFNRAGTNVRGANVIALPSASALAAWTKTLTLAITFKPLKIELSYFICIPYDKTFHMVPNFFTLWPWPWSLTYFWKTLTLVITFLPDVIRLSYCTCVLLVARPFTWYHIFLPLDLDLEVWPTFEKL